MGSLQAGVIGKTDALGLPPSATPQERVRAAFAKYDKDGSGSISVAELKESLAEVAGGGGAGEGGRSLSDAEMESIVKEFDANGDGELQYDEFAALWTRNQLQSGDPTGFVAPARDAIVVCGYGEIGSRVCEALGMTPGGAPSHICIDRNPARISAGVINNAPVVYGDGASETLLRALGVEAPRAILITYANPARCLSSTSRLRKAFPSTPIFVRTERQQEADELKEAGATAVVVETSESAVRFAELLGVQDGAKGSRIEQRLRGLPSSLTSSPEARAEQDGWDAPYSRAELDDLAEQVGATLDEVLELYDAFASLDANDDAEVPTAELRELLIRTSEMPLDDETLDSWRRADLCVVGADGEEMCDFGNGPSESAGFYEFVRLWGSMRGQVGVLK